MLQVSKKEEVNFIGLKKIGFKLGKQPRNPFKSTDTPGPGNYDASDKSMFSKQNGRINPDANNRSNGPEYPGPGSYDANFYVGKNQNPKFPFGKEQKPSIQNHNPGPGSYESNSSIQKQSFGFSKEDRGGKLNNRNPGPGSYDANIEAVKNMNAKSSFGKERRTKDIDRGQMGPGDYDIPHSIPDVGSWNYPAKSNLKIHL